MVLLIMYNNLKKKRVMRFIFMLTAHEFADCIHRILISADFKFKRKGTYSMVVNICI